MKHLCSQIALAPIRASARRGSTILIVVVLMAMLAFLGVVFYTFSAQEYANALTFSQQAKVTKAVSVEPDALFDFALQQIILGPDDTNTQSILWGGRHSLLANMYGRDGIPFNGEGVNLMQTAAGQPQVDMNFNGSSADANDNQQLLNPIDSPAANPGVLVYGSSGAPWGTGKRFRGTASLDATQDIPDPDVNYNSPDINSLFLSYDGNAVNTAGVASRVLIPSFFRPQYLRTGATHRTDWYSNAATANQVMRPHPNHICVDDSGNAITITINSVTTNVSRFVNGSEMDTLVTPNRPLYQSLGLKRPFTTTAGNFAPVKADGSATTGKLGVWSSNGQNDIDLDVDTDGDGILDAILMDLGYPPIRRGDGKLVVPLFAISIRDLNGLLNVNATGNLSGNLDTSGISATHQLGYRKTGPSTYVPDSLSKSNLGLSTYEINIQRALTADPTDPSIADSAIGQQLAYFLKLFDSSITTSPAQPGRSVSELANLEWLLLNIGRAQFHLQSASTASPLTKAINVLYPGRFGEVGRILKFLTTFLIEDLPGAGKTVTLMTPPVLPTASDDDDNADDGESVLATRWVHPLDFLGSGQQFQRFEHGADGQPGAASVDDDSNGVVDDFSEEGWAGSDDSPALYGPYGKSRELLRNGANLWPAYSGFHSYNLSAAGGVRWGETDTTGATYSGQLMRDSRWYSLLDDPTESIIDPTLMSPNYSGYSSLDTARKNDAVFGPEEMPFLQGSESDARRSTLHPRLAELMPANLVASDQARDIRKRLTTVSSDRREYGYGTSAVGGVRSWETTVNQFPPSLNLGAASPYRAELFDLLRQEGNAGVSNWQMKLNVNQLLEDAGTQLQFRPLAAHDPTALPTVGNNPVAHYERQLMARDIYTLLYTLCQGVDTDYRSSTAPTAAQVREMAQFAVNVVDALDTDDIITAFYYDPDLSTAGGGWPVATNTTDPTTPTHANATEVVYGVERQLLTFSEALAFRVGQVATDSDMTIFDDTLTDATNGRRYVFFELQNVTPMKVPLATTASIDAATSTWRVTLQDGSNTAKSRVNFLSGLYNAQYPSTIQSDLTLPAAAVFTVGSQDGSDAIGGKYRTSDFRADINDPFDNTFERIVPSGGTADTVGIGSRIVPIASTPQANFPTAKCDLDLVWDETAYLGSTPAFVLETSPTTPGSFAASLDAATTNFRLVLERRASDGTFTVVDQTALQTMVTVTPPAMSTGVNAVLNGLVSQERRTPLSRTAENAATAAAPKRNSFKTANGDSTATLWQHHNDRDFATIAELFQIPLYGPARLTDGRLGDLEFADRTILDSTVSSDPLYPAATNSNYIPTIAAARFLRPDNPDQSGLSNRWYRLLQFLEVPNRSHQHPTIATQSALTTPTPSLLAEPYDLPIGFGWPRTHGQLNLNMIRDSKVLAALLDDDLLIDGATPNLTGLDEGGRLWWVEFLKARDSRYVSGSGFSPDPTTGLFVPGTANARPFRSFDSAGVTNVPNPTDSPLENTILRSLPLDGAGTNPNESRRLFEVGLNGSEHFGPLVDETTVGNDPLHPSARYRLLSKILNNVTTRSNSFGVFVTVQYYEAAEVSSDVANLNAIRIGGRLDDTPTHRGYFVVDRTGAVEQMKRLSENVSTGRITVANPPTFPVSSNSFGFQANTNTSGDPNYMNGIRWQDLVLFRNTLN